MSPPFLLNLHPHTKYYNMYLRINFTVLILSLSKHAINMRFNEQCCSFTHGGGESRTFQLRGLCQLLTE